MVIKEVACRKICPRDFLGHVGTARLLKGQGLRRLWKRSRTSICFSTGSVAREKKRKACVKKSLWAKYESLAKEEDRQIPLVHIIIWRAHATCLLGSWNRAQPLPILVHRLQHASVPRDHQHPGLSVPLKPCVFWESDRRLLAGWTSRKPGITFPYRCLEMSSHALSTGRRKLLEYAPCRAWVGSVGGAYQFANVTRRGSMA